MLLWPFNKYPGTDYETYNWEWILKTVKEWVATMQTFKRDITAGWDAMRDDFSTYVNVTKNALNTGAIADGAVTYQKFSDNVTSTMDDEYLAMGGTFGVNQSDEQREINCTCLNTLFAKYNAINFKTVREIEVIDWHVIIKERSKLSNILIHCYYTASTDPTIYTNTIARSTQFDNVTIINESGELCKGGMIFADIKYHSNTIALPVSSFDRITVSGYKIPFVIFGWNVNVGEIVTSGGSYGPVFLGTSMNVGAVYALEETHGISLGVYPDYNDVIYNEGDIAYLYYSHFGILSCDSHLTQTSAVLQAGLTRGIAIDCLAYEILNGLVNVIDAYTKELVTTSYWAINIDSIYASGTPSGKFYHKVNNASGYHEITINNLFGEYIAQALTNSDYFDGIITKQNLYTSRSSDKLKGVLKLVNTAGTNRQHESNTFKGVIGNVSGTANNIDGLYTYTPICGTLNKGEAIKFRMFSTQSANDTFTRNTVILIRMSIAPNNTYNSSTNKQAKSFTVAAALDVYTSGADYTNEVYTDGLPDGWTVNIDSSESLPIMTITAPTAAGNNPASFVYMADVIGGYRTEIYK